MRKYFLFITGIILLILFCIGSNAQLLEKKEFRLKNQEHSLNFSSQKIVPVKPIAIGNNKKSMLFAGGLSFIVPGAALGQLYNKQYLNFGIRIGISALSIIWLAESGLFNLASDVKGNDAWMPLLLIYTANWITSIVDAVIYNKKHLSGR